MESPLDFVLRRMTEIKPELDRLAAMPGKLSSPQNARYRALSDDWDALDERRKDLEDRMARAEASGINFTSRGDDPEPSFAGSAARSNALYNLERSRLPDGMKANAIAKIDEWQWQQQAPTLNRFAELATNVDYLSAYRGWFADPEHCHMRWSPKEAAAFNKVNEEYRTMTAGTGSSGGFLVPLYLDPSFVISGAGARNPYRQVAEIKPISTLTYNGSTAAQITAGLLGENAAFSDNSPVLSQVQIPTYKIGAYIPASFEAFEDIDALAQDVANAFLDSKVNYEATQFTTGSGSAPHGAVADVTAVTASRVSPATGGTFVVGDVYKVHAALPARFRNGDPSKRAWMANVSVIDAMRQFATANNYMGFLADMSEGQPPRLLGDGLYEASAMDSAVTTGNNVLLLGDFSRFYIIDRLGLTTEYIPNIFDTSTGRPTGTRAWLTHWRVGSLVADPNAFRVLKL